MVNATNRRTAWPAATGEHMSMTSTAIPGEQAPKTLLASVARQDAPKT
jgi:hypothetical protein